MGRPNLRRNNLWKKQEVKILQVLKLSLQFLAQEKNLPENENALNRRLYFNIFRAIRELHNRGVDVIFYPIYEGNNQPDVSDEEKAAREDKRPDFQFGFIDHQEPNPDASAKQYAVECKRLGKSGRSDWVLNTNYMDHGITRYCQVEHGYGKSSSSGAMIGYIQNQSSNQILDEVNEALDARGLPRLALSEDGWHRGDVSNLMHRFNREVQPTPFDLCHLWLDLQLG